MDTFFESASFSGAGSPNFKMWNTSLHLIRFLAEYSISECTINPVNLNVILSTVDQTLPVIDCLAGITEETSLGSPGTVVTWEELTATDNSGVVALSECSHAPGSFFIVGSTDVTYTFTDGSGNQAQCTFTVTVVEGKQK